MHNKKTLVLALVFLIILIISCAPKQSFFPEKVNKTKAIVQSSQEPDAKETVQPIVEEKELVEETEPSAVLAETKQTFPRKDIKLYLGFWMPALQGEGEQSLEKREDLLALGANTVAFGVVIPYFPDGTLDAEEVAVSKEDARRLIRHYKESGLAVVFSPEPVPAYLEGEPTPVPANVRETLLRNYETVIIDLGTIAEEENVEIFSPMNEPDYKLGYETASSWGQEILPRIRQVYTGELMWKGMSTQDGSKLNQVDFSGYDVIGFTSFPWSGIDKYKTELGSFITTLQKKAAEDGVNKLIAAELGTYEPLRLSKQEEPKSIQYVFDEGKGKLQGFFVFDPPSGFGTPIKGSELENVVKVEFEKLKE